MKHLPSVTIEVVEHSDQKYDTCGNYGEGLDCWWMEISKLPKWQYEALIAIHELVEMVLTKDRKISWDKITKFDNTFIDEDDPGNMKIAPYHKEHKFATKLEKMLCSELGLDWKKYDKAVNSLKWN